MISAATEMSTRTQDLIVDNVVNAEMNNAETEDLANHTHISNQPPQEASTPTTGQYRLLAVPLEALASRVLGPGPNQPSKPDEPPTEPVSPFSHKD